MVDGNVAWESGFMAIFDINHGELIYIYIYLLEMWKQCTYAPVIFKGLGDVLVDELTFGVHFVPHSYGIHVLLNNLISILHNMSLKHSICKYQTTMNEPMPQGGRTCNLPLPWSL